MLLVGGGYATRALATPDSAIVRWITAAHPTTKYTTSVCTGSLLLGAAGLLRGLRATTHWHAAPLLAAYGAADRPVPLVSFAYAPYLAQPAGLALEVANSIFVGGKLLTTPLPGRDDDQLMLADLGMKPMAMAAQG